VTFFHLTYIFYLFCFPSFLHKTVWW